MNDLSITQSYTNEVYHCGVLKKLRRLIFTFFKRIFDFSISLIMLLILSPILVIIGIFIKLDSKGPMFMILKLLISILK